MSVEQVGAPPLGVSPPTWSGRWLKPLHWERAVALIAIACAVTVLWITLRANFLAHPGWLAVQKADFILGPIGVGL